MGVRASDFEYDLDEALIAQQPLERRDQSRLMILRRADGLAPSRAEGRVTHHTFAELPGLLRKGDVLVVNQTAVIPARFACRRRTGAKIEGLFLRQVQVGLWEVLLNGAGRCRPDEVLPFEGQADTSIRLAENLSQGRWRVEVQPAEEAAAILGRLGATPLPPYIRRPGRSALGETAALRSDSQSRARPGEQAEDEIDRRRYQTVYASVPGAVAAPTAGLHFTPELLARLEEAGVQIARLTLHVGLGTFGPVKVEDLEQHRMHAEWFDLPAATANALNAARSEGRRIVAVGTTSVRVLETVAAGGVPCFCPQKHVPGLTSHVVPANSAGSMAPGPCPQTHASGKQRQKHGTPPLFSPQSGWTDIFIYPPCRFRAVDALITNFHLPRSTLLMLVAAFCSPGRTDGIRTVLDAYAEAQRLRYRFYSYGDAMLIE